MKKVLLLLTVFMLVGCQGNKQVEETNMYQDGTYNATVNGYGGDFDMTVTIQDGKVLDVVVGENNETPSIGGVAIEQLINQMKEKQDGTIDTVAGATKTSQGMINAYEEILSKAKNKAE